MKPAWAAAIWRAINRLVPARDARRPAAETTITADLVASLSRPPRVLVIDDNPLVSDLIRSHLDDLGIETVAVGRVSAAIEAYAKAMTQHQRTEINRNPFAFLLVDYYLPDGTGYDVIKRVAEINRTQPQVLYTGHDLPYDPEMPPAGMWFKAGADVFKNIRTICHVLRVPIESTPT